MWANTKFIEQFVMSYYFHQYIDYRLKNTQFDYPIKQSLNPDQFFTLQQFKYNTTGTNRSTGANTGLY